MAIAGELVSSVVDALVTEGFRRGYHEIKTAVRRRHAIDPALSGHELKNDERLKHSISDLEVVIGSARGELSEAVAAFIREIERSAIPESVIRCVLTNSDPESIYPAFEVIFRAFAGSISFDPKRFFTALVTAITMRVDQKVKGPAMLEFVQAQNKGISKQLTEIMTALRKSSELTEPLSASEISVARLGLARAFESSNKYMTVETVQGANKCRIKHLAVPPRLASVTSPTKRHVKKARADIEEVLDDKPEASSIPYVQFKTTVHRAVILGDPGGGKSTLTQLLRFDNSNSILLEASFPGRPEIDSAELRIPLRVISRSFDKRRQTEVVPLPETGG